MVAAKVCRSGWWPRTRTWRGFVERTTPRWAWWTWSWSSPKAGASRYPPRLRKSKAQPCRGAVGVAKLGGHGRKPPSLGQLFGRVNEGSFVDGGESAPQSGTEFASPGLGVNRRGNGGERMLNRRRRSRRARTIYGRVSLSRWRDPSKSGWTWVDRGWLAVHV